MNSFCFTLGGFSFSVSFDDKKFHDFFLKHFSEFITNRISETLLSIDIKVNNDIYLPCPSKEGKNITITPNSKKPFQTTVLELNWKLKTAIIGELSNHNFLLLHASCIIIGNKAFALSGDSGAGKSTSSKIAEKNGFLKPCDDSVLIHVEKRKLTVHSTPFIEKEKTFYENNQWKLDSIYFLKQSKQDRKIKLNKIDSIKKILKNSYLADYEANIFMSPKSFDLAEKITEKIDCYDLEFTKSNKFIETIQK